MSTLLYLSVMLRSHSLELFKSQYLWIVLILVNIANAYMLKRWAQPNIEADKRLEKGYNTMARVSAIVLSIPWVIMGIGMLSGKVTRTVDFYNPAAMNPFVLAVYAAVIAILLVGAYWIYFKNGAAFLAEHPSAMLRGSLRSTGNIPPLRIKLTYALVVLAILAVQAFLWFNGALLVKG